MSGENQGNPFWEYWDREVLDVFDQEYIDMVNIAFYLGNDIAYDAGQSRSQKIFIEGDTWGGSDVYQSVGYEDSIVIYAEPTHTSYMEELLTYMPLEQYGGMAPYVDSERYEDIFVGYNEAVFERVAEINLAEECAGRDPISIAKAQVLRDRIYDVQLGGREMTPLPELIDAYYAESLADAIDDLSEEENLQL